MPRPKGSRNKMSDSEKVADKIDGAIENMDESDDVIEYVDKDKLIPTGLTLLNLACTDTIDGGAGMGKINTIPGSSSSGKTFLVYNMLAAIANNPRFDEYELIFDDVEHASEFNISHLFGDKLKNRIISPRYDKNGIPINSNTIQEFKSNILMKSNEGIKFIWVLDSLDALSTDEEIEKEYKEAVRDAKSPEHIKELKGSFNTEKAKILGQILRMIKKEVKNTDSSVNILQQLRQKINAGPFEKKHATSGGEAPYFYSTHQWWLSKKASHKDDIYKKVIGQRTKLDVSKNKMTGKKRTIEFDIFDSFGIDNIGANIDFLLENNIWKKAGKTIKAPEFDMDFTSNSDGKAKDQLIDYIENNNLEEDLDEIVGVSWSYIEDSMKLKRKKRFS
ncbi:MAG: hypothetical protein GQ540_03905 [Lutibacter sp.]|uniref:hypothetical protein n=1 Tax=Lutibacter sp. TaxID=1925666 RepID=UPI0019E6DC6E|nr:hypothetical protein [Lutibacter sp.]NOR27658.1 hypothetical protein [Lutibacter sp.]